MYSATTSKLTTDAHVQEFKKYHFKQHSQKKKPFVSNVLCSVISLSSSELMEAISVLSKLFNFVVLFVNFYKVDKIWTSSLYADFVTDLYAKLVLNYGFRDRATLSTHS